MKTLIEKFNALKEQSSIKSSISHLLDNVNNACFFALNAQEHSDNTIKFFDGFVLKIEDCISELISVVENYGKSKKISEVSDKETE